MWAWRGAAGYDPTRELRPWVAIIASRMGKIVVSQNAPLDGVVEDLSGEGGFGHGDWFVWSRGVTLFYEPFCAGGRHLVTRVAKP